MTDTEVRCPVCETGHFPTDAVDPSTGMVACQCGHLADAAFLSEAAYLEARLAWVRDRIRAGDRASAPEVAIPALPGPVSVQTALLSIGALLLVVAAAVFTAVAWPRLGPAGQLAMIVAATGLVTFLALRLRRRLPGTAQALAALAFGLAAVVLVALPALGVAPQQWQQTESPYLFVVSAALAVAAVVGGRVSGLRSWSWLGWASASVAAGAATGLAAGPSPFDDGRLMLATTVLAVSGVLLVTGSWVVAALRLDRGPMLLAGTITLVLASAVVAGSAIGGVAVAESAVTTGVTAAVLGVLARVAGADSPRVFAWGSGLLAVIATGLLLTLLPATGVVGLVVAAVGGAILVVGVRRDATPNAATPAVTATAVLWATWLTLQDVSWTAALPQVSESVRWFTVGAAVALFAAGWLGRSRSTGTWLAWPGAAVGIIAFALLTPSDYPEVLEAWTLPAAVLLLALAGWVALPGRPAGSLERIGPALSVALLPSAAATWLAPWVLGLGDADAEQVVRLGLVLATGAALMVLGTRNHWLGVLLPASAAVAIAGLAQLWTGLDALPRWVALAMVGTLLVLAGARFEWLRDEGRKARSWMHEMA